MSGVEVALLAASAVQALGALQAGDAQAKQLEAEADAAKEQGRRQLEENARETSAAQARNRAFMAAFGGLGTASASALAMSAGLRGAENAGRIAFDVQAQRAGLKFSARQARVEAGFNAVGSLLSGGAAAGKARAQRLASPAGGSP